MVSLKDLKGTKSNDIIGSDICTAEGTQMNIMGKEVEILFAKPVSINEMDFFSFFVAKDQEEMILGLAPNWINKDNTPAAGSLSYINQNQTGSEKEFISEAFNVFSYDSIIDFTLDEAIDIEINGKIHKFIPKIKTANLIIGFEKRSYGIEMPIIIEGTENVWIPIGEEFY